MLEVQHVLGMCWAGDAAEHMTRGRVLALLRGRRRARGGSAAAGGRRWQGAAGAAPSTPRLPLARPPLRGWRQLRCMRFFCATPRHLGCSLSCPCRHHQAPLLSQLSAGSQWRSHRMNFNKLRPYWCVMKVCFFTCFLLVDSYDRLFHWPVKAIEAVLTDRPASQPHQPVRRRLILGLRPLLQSQRTRII